MCTAAARLAIATAELSLQHSNESTKHDTNPEINLGTRQGGQNRKASAMPKGMKQMQQVISPPAAPSFILDSKPIEIKCMVNDVDEEYYNCVLPDDVLVELLADRMQVIDFSGSAF